MKTKPWISNTDFFVTVISMALLALHYSIGLLGLLWPIRKMNISMLKLLNPIFLIIIIKLSSLLFMPLGYYARYNFNINSMLREIGTIILFYLWFIIGFKLYNFSFFTSLSKTVQTGCLIFVPFVQIFAVGAPIMHNIDGAQAIYYFIIFVILFDLKYNFYYVLFIFIILMLTSTSLVSSYTTISCLCLVFVFCIRYTVLSRIIIPWRTSVYVAILFLTFASLFASNVNLKDATVSEGNNGAAREHLAQAAFSVFVDFPLFGTPFGRGIVPIEAVENLGWEQYLDPDIGREMAEAEAPGSAGYDIYSLSFHNGFLYLLTRYGMLSFFFIYLIVRYVPRKGPLPIVVFSVVVLLSISANVVIESLRAGPGVALVLGALFSFKRQAILKTEIMRPLAGEPKKGAGCAEMTGKG